MTIFKIKVVLTVNVKGVKPFLLTVKNAAPDDKIPKDDDYKPDTDLPYFTTDNEYSEDTIQSLDANKQWMCFFNKALFSDILIKRDHALSPEDREQNAEKNVEIMLKTLFRNYADTANRLSVIEPERMQLFRFKKRGSKKIKINGSDYSVKRAVWLNDVANNPTFRSLFTNIERLKIDLSSKKTNLDTTIQEEREEFDRRVDGLKQTIDERADAWLLNEEKQGGTVTDKFLPFKMKLDTELKSIETWHKQYIRTGQIGFTTQQITNAINNIKNALTSDPFSRETVYNTFLELDKLSQQLPKTIDKNKLLPTSLLNDHPEFIKAMNRVRNIEINRRILYFIDNPMEYLSLTHDKVRSETNLDAEVFRILNGYKYSEFGDIIKLLKPYSENKVRVSNPKLQYLLLHSNKFMDLAEKILKDDAASIVPTGVILNLKGQGNTAAFLESEIFVSLEVESGEIMKMNCLLKNDRLVGLYKTLRNKGRPAVKQNATSSKQKNIFYYKPPLTITPKHNITTKHK